MLLLLLLHHAFLLGVLLLVVPPPLVVEMPVVEVLFLVVSLVAQAVGMVRDVGL
jgi:hypothetical protein